MAAARAVVERTLADGVEAAGVTTGVGVTKTFRVADAGHDALLLRQHLIAQGPPLPRDVVEPRRLGSSNAFARGSPARGPSSPAASWTRSTTTTCRARSAPSGRPTSRRRPTSPSASSETSPRAEAGIAPLNQNAFSAGHAALAVHDAQALLGARSTSPGRARPRGARREPRVAAPPALASARPSPGLQVTLDRLSALVAGSEVSTRSLQDPLSFRTLPQLHGAARDALDYVASRSSAS